MIKNSWRFLDHITRTSSYQKTCNKLYLESEDAFNKRIESKLRDIERQKEYKKEHPEKFVDCLSLSDSEFYNKVLELCNKPRFISAFRIQRIIRMIYCYNRDWKDLCIPVLKHIHEHPMTFTRKKQNYFEYKEWKKETDKFIGVCKNKLGLEYGN